MKAIVQDTYGPPDVLELRDIDPPVAGDGEVLLRVHAAGVIHPPVAGDGEVLLRVHAAGVDQGVWHLAAGKPYLVRIAGVGVRAPKNPVPGTTWQDVWSRSATA